MVRIILWLLVAAELIGAGYLAQQRTLSPSAPSLDLTRMMRSVASDFRIAENRVKSDRAEDWQALGEGYLAYGYFSAGIASLTRAWEKDPTNAETALNLARCLERVWKIAEANEYYAKSAELGGAVNAKMCKFRIGRNYLRLGEPENAIKAFLSAGAYHAASFELARVYHKLGRNEESAKLIEAMRSDGRIESGIEMLAIKVYTELNRPEERVAGIERIERSQAGLTGDDHAIYFDSVRSRFGFLKKYSAALDLAGKQRQTEAWSIIDGILDEVSEDEIEAWVPGLLGQGIKMNLHDEVRKMAERFEVRQVFYGAMLEGYGISCQRAGRFDQADLLLSKLIASTSSVDAYESLVKVASEKQDPARGAKLEQELNYLQALQQYRSGNLLAAEVAALKAFSGNTQDVRIIFLLASIHQGLGKKEIAIRELKDCVRLDPHYYPARERLAEMLKLNAPSS